MRFDLFRNPTKMPSNNPTKFPTMNSNTKSPTQRPIPSNTKWEEKKTRVINLKLFFLFVGKVPTSTPVEPTLSPTLQPTEHRDCAATACTTWSAWFENAFFFVILL